MELSHRTGRGERVRARDPPQAETNKKRASNGSPFHLSFLNEARPAFGAADADLAFAAGNPQLLLAGGAAENLVVFALLTGGAVRIFILQLPPELQELLVFLLTGVNIAGKDAQITHDQHRPAKDTQNAEPENTAAQ